MSDAQQIYVHPGCPHCWKVLIAAEFVGKSQEVVNLTWEQTKQPEYLQKNPSGKVPTLMTSKGPIFESHAVLRTLARANTDKHLYGKSNFESAKVDQWLDWNVDLVNALYGTWGAINGLKTIDEKTYSSNLETLKNKLKVLEEHLNGKKYLVGDNVTIADISFVALMRGPVACALDTEFRNQLPNVFNYYKSLASLPEVQKVLGKPRFCEKRWPLAEPVAAPKKEEKKEAPKKEAPKKKKDDDEDEDDKPAPPKKDDAKAELENLPPSPFNFFDFKTLITNAKDKNEALKTFWEQFDAAGYSLWFIEYEKAEGEGKVVYLTNNLMNGFLQRLDHFRKYAYGVYGVYGDEPNLEVRGVLCWRSPSIPIMIKEHDQYDYHRFTQLHPEKPADKKKVEEFWTKLNEDEDVVDGLTARTVKIFK